jgi:hypothetical protein
MQLQISVLYSHRYRLADDSEEIVSYCSLSFYIEPRNFV